MFICFLGRIHHLSWFRCCREEDAALRRAEQAAARDKVVKGLPEDSYFTVV